MIRSNSFWSAILSPTFRSRHWAKNRSGFPLWPPTILPWTELTCVATARWVGLDGGSLVSGKGIPVGGNTAAVCTNTTSLLLQKLCMNDGVQSSTCTRSPPPPQLGPISHTLAPLSGSIEIYGPWLLYCLQRLLLRLSVTPGGVSLLCLRRSLHFLRLVGRCAGVCCCVRTRGFSHTWAKVTARRDIASGGGW